MQDNYNPQVYSSTDILRMQYTGQFVDTKSQAKKKYDDFIERISAFKEVKTLEEAKAVAEKILPVKYEITRFSVGEAKCIIINKEDVFRISVDSPEAFICYNFV